jgi:ABC-type transporter Mla MlaB component
LECRRAAMSAGKSITILNLPAKLRELAGLYGIQSLLAA